MNFLKKASKSVVKAANNAANGVVLEVMKSKKARLIRRQARLTAKFEEFKKRQCEIDMIIGLINSNEEQKAAFSKKLIAEPIESISFRETYQQVIDVLTTANVSLNQIVVSLQERVGVITTNKTDKVANSEHGTEKKKRGDGAGEAAPADTSCDEDEMSDLDNDDDYDDIRQIEEYLKGDRNKQADGNVSSAVYVTINEDYYAKKTAQFEKELKEVNDNLASLRGKN